MSKKKDAAALAEATGKKAPSTRARNKMLPETKFVTDPLTSAKRLRGGKAGTTHVFLPHGHPSRTHDLHKGD